MGQAKYDYNKHLVVLSMIQLNVCYFIMLTLLEALIRGLLNCINFANLICKNNKKF